MPNAADPTGLDIDCTCGIAVTRDVEHLLLHITFRIDPALYDLYFL